MASQAQVREFLKRREALARALAGMSEGAGNDLSAMLDRVSRELIRIVGREISPTGAAISSDKQVRAILNEIDAALQQMGAASRKVYREHYTRVLREYIGEVPTLYGVLGRTNARKLLGAADSFRTNARGKYMQAGLRSWLDDLGRLSGDLRSDFRKSLVNAQLNGLDRRALANDLLKRPTFTWENLPQISEKQVRRLYSGGGVLTDQQALTRRAHAIARTQLTAARNQAEAGWAEEVGWDRFIAINGDPVSDICNRAVNEPPMLREEWLAAYGWPPFHHQCDTQMVSVPPDEQESIKRAVDEAAPKE